MIDDEIIYFYKNYNSIKFAQDFYGKNIQNLIAPIDYNFSKFNLLISQIKIEQIYKDKNLISSKKSRSIL